MTASSCLTATGSWLNTAAAAIHFDGACRQYVDQVHRHSHVLGPLLLQHSIKQLLLAVPVAFGKSRFKAKCIRVSWCTAKAMLVTVSYAGLHYWQWLWRVLPVVTQALLAPQESDATSNLPCSCNSDSEKADLAIRD